MVSMDHIFVCRNNRKRNTDTEAATNTTWKEGDTVEGNFKGGGTWYPGRIDRVNGYDTYDVLYDDGDTERCKPSSEIRAIKLASPATDEPVQLQVQ